MWQIFDFEKIRKRNLLNRLQTFPPTRIHPQICIFSTAHAED